MPRWPRWRCYGPRRYAIRCAFHAAERAVKDVYIAGRKVVADGRVTTLDHQNAAARLTEAQVKIMQATPARDYLGRTADAIAPLSLPVC